ncbi:hypothetical protein IE322_24895 [Pseudomonas asiatica]|uniref:hypothetical protein n=1 Tax=Pseudomonas asiatica TaxID=2219225 RepID=UPI0011D56E4F|nr:hypothetical protein [Pseudomonas asiatica]QOE08392.1 hypothetical protein IE322_24895 [Pseudomonas asiatica]TXG96643.1 MAG: hypothetical protein E6R08_08915 [Nevskiaceae bacterium]
MANFTVRIEIVNSTPESEANLLKVMARAGFSQEVQGEDDAFYSLPHGEFSIKDSSLSGREVRDLAKAATQEIGKEAAILVTEGRRFWSGLKRKR